MLKVNVGMSRKLTRDYNSTGFSVNVEGEVLASPDDPEMVLEKIKELYDLAEESLIDQLKRHSDDFDERQQVKNEQAETTSAKTVATRYSGGQNGRVPGVNRVSPANGQTNGHVNGEQSNGHNSGQSNGNAAQATNKQIQFLLTLGKQRGLTKPQLEEDITEIVGRSTDVYGLTKSEAGLVLDRFTNGHDKSTRSRR